MRNRRHEIEELPVINVTNMIDIMLTLLLFFMLMVGAKQANQVEVDLPESTSFVKGEERPALTVVYHMVEGRAELSVNNQPVAGLTELADTMRGLAKPEDSPRVNLRIDKTVPYQEVITLMDTVRDAGFPRFSLPTVAPTAVHAPAAN